MAKIKKYLRLRKRLEKDCLNFCYFLLLWMFKEGDEPETICNVNFLKKNKFYWIFKAVCTNIIVTDAL